jgi:hypothetical protein
LARRPDLQIAFGLTLLCVVTRILALPASLWEWDDILFARAIHRFDLVDHSPHPPGFPVFVMMARAAYLFIRDEQIALSFVSLVFSSFLGAALYFFYREVFRDRWTAVAGALIGSLVPNVWIHSGAARSDSPGLTFGIVGLALILHGLQSRRSLWLGCAVFGLGMGVRVTVLPVVAPTLAVVLLIHLLRRNWKVVAVSLAIAAAGALSWYIPLVVHTTWRVYRWVMNQHAQFTFQNDTIISPTENSILSYRFRRFFIEMWGAQWIMLAIYTSSTVGLLALALRRRWRIIGWMCLAFLPFLIFTLLLNTPLSAPLYSLPYTHFFTGMAAAGCVEAMRLVFGARRRYGNIAGLALAATLAIAIGSWSYPVVRMLHREVSPPVRAMQELQKKFNRGEDVIYYDGLLSQHVFYFLPGVKSMINGNQFRAETNLIGPIVANGRSYNLTITPPLGDPGTYYHWGRRTGEKRLRPVSLGRFFDVYLSDMTATSGVNFLTGWYDEESSNGQSWRWMSGHGRVAVMSTAEKMKLHLKVVAASEEGKESPTIILRLDGREIDRFSPQRGEFDRNVLVTTDPTRLWSTLSIETDRIVIPSRINGGDDNRELGLQCLSLQWVPAENAKPIARTSEQFLGPGWHQLEIGNTTLWRWSSGNAITHLPAIDGDGQLDLRMVVPDRADGTRPEVVLTINGRVIERVSPPEGVFDRSYFIPASVHRGAQAELTLSVKEIVEPLDGRPLGLQMHYIGWRPTAGVRGNTPSDIKRLD